MSRSRRSGPPAPLRVSFEEIEIRTSDGASLRAVVDDPPDGTPFVGTCVFAHAVFARKSSYGRRDRPGLAAAYNREGFRTIAFDFRGHGDSAAPDAQRDWSYDDLVRFDLPAVVECARARGEGLPVVLVGHSLGAHVGLAALGTGKMRVDGVVAIAGNVWLRALEPSRVRWAAKLAVTYGLGRLAARTGRLPARALRFGSDDASGRFARDLVRATRHGWTSDDGEDYLASLARIDVPVCAVGSDADMFIAHLSSVEAMLWRCGGPTKLVRITRGDDGGPPPGHMGIVTTDRARRPLLEALGWVLEEVNARRARGPLSET